MRLRRAVGATLVTGVLVAGLSACGSDTEPTPAAEVTSSTTTSAPRTTTSTTVPSTVKSTPAVPSTTAAPVPPATTAPSSAAPVATTVLMPAVGCMNLQAAQNLIQDLGVFYSRSVDASGLGRKQVIDSNWIVVGQTPGVGVPVGEGDAVLSVVKVGEPSPC